MESSFQRAETPVQDQSYESLTKLQGSQKRRSVTLNNNNDILTPDPGQDGLDMMLQSQDKKVISMQLGQSHVDEEGTHFNRLSQSGASPEVIPQHERSAEKTIEKEFRSIKVRSRPQSSHPGNPQQKPTSAENKNQTETPIQIKRDQISFQQLPIAPPFGANNVPLRQMSQVDQSSPTHPGRIGKQKKAPTSAQTRIHQSNKTNKSKHRAQTSQSKSDLLKSPFDAEKNIKQTMAGLNRSEEDNYQNIFEEQDGNAASFQNETIQDSVKSGKDSFNNTAHLRATFKQDDSTTNINVMIPHIEMKKKKQIRYSQPARKLKKKKKAGDLYSERETPMQVQHMTNYKYQAMSLKNKQNFGETFTDGKPRKQYVDNLVQVHGNNFVKVAYQGSPQTTMKSNFSQLLGYDPSLALSSKHRNTEQDLRVIGGKMKSMVPQNKLRLSKEIMKRPETRTGNRNIIGNNTQKNLATHETTTNINFTIQGSDSQYKPPKLNKTTNQASALDSQEGELALQMALAEQAASESVRLDIDNRKMSAFESADQPSAWIMAPNYEDINVVKQNQQIQMTNQNEDIQSDKLDNAEVDVRLTQNNETDYTEHPYKNMNRPVSKYSKKLSSQKLLDTSSYSMHRQSGELKNLLLYRSNIKKAEVLDDFKIKEQLNKKTPKASHLETEQQSAKGEEGQFTPPKRSGTATGLNDRWASKFFVKNSRIQSSQPRQHMNITANSFSQRDLLRSSGASFQNYQNRTQQAMTQLQDLTEMPTDNLLFNWQVNSALNAQDEQVKLQEMNVRERIDYIVSKKMKARNAAEAKTRQAIDTKHEREYAQAFKDKGGGFIRSHQKKHRKTLNQQAHINFDFNVQNTKNFRAKSREKRQDELKQDQKLFYDMKKYNQQNVVGSETNQTQTFDNNQSYHERGEDTINVMDEGMPDAQASYLISQGQTDISPTPILKKKDPNQAADRKNHRSRDEVTFSVQKNSTQHRKSDQKLNIYQKKEIEWKAKYDNELKKIRMMPDGLLGKLKDQFGNEIEGSVMTTDGPSRLASVVEEASFDKTEKGGDTKRTDARENTFYSAYKKPEDESYTFKVSDLNFYPGLDRIISNRINLLKINHKQNKQYLHDDQKKAMLDPLRSKVRVATISKVQQSGGKSTIGYFIEATKHCLRNDLSKAILVLHKGLAIDSTNYYARLTHGVIMFKLGLFTQAATDFKLVTQHHSKEPFGHFNYALTLLQLGKFKKALDALEPITSKNSTSLLKDLGVDAQFMYDAFTLKGLCLWRNGMENTNKVDKDYIAEAVKPMVESSKHLHQNEIIMDQLRKYVHEPTEKEVEDFDLMIHSCDIVDKGGLNAREWEEFFQLYQDYLEQSFRVNMRWPANLQATVYSMLKVGKFISDDLIKQVINVFWQKFLSRKPPLKPIEAVKALDCARKFKSKVTQRKLVQLTEQQLEAQLKDLAIQDMKIDIQQETQWINLSRSKSPEVEYLTRFKEAKGSTEESEGYVITQDEQRPKKEHNLLEQLNRRNTEMIYSDLDHAEKKRRSKSQYNIVSEIVINETQKQSELDQVQPQQQQQEQDSSKEKEGNTRNSVDTEIKKDIYDGTICGSMQQETMNYILFEQYRLEEMLTQLQQKLNQNIQGFFRDIDKEDKRIFYRPLKELDVAEYKTKMKFQQKQKTKQSWKDQQQRDDYNDMLYNSQNDKVMEKLRDTLKGKKDVPIDLCNVLQADLDQKMKMRKMQQDNQQSLNDRIDSRTLKMIQDDMELPANKRSIDNLDLVLGSLKFFQKYNNRQRKMIYEQATYAQYDGRQTIFEQGDPGTKMYVILKGRVAVVKAQAQYGNIPLCEVILDDGKWFGELSMIDSDKIDKHTKETAFLEEDDFQGRRKTKFQGRQASCITVEQTDLLEISQELASKLFQEDKKKREKSMDSQDPHAEDKIEGVDDTSMCTSQRNDLLSRKIRILQNTSYFSDISSRSLMPIAINASIRTYKLGEYLVEKNKQPDGLFIIIKGQCQVVAQRNTKRKLGKVESSNEIMKWLPATNEHQRQQKQQTKSSNYKQMSINDRVIQGINPETSLLNLVQTSVRAFQNQRVMIDSEGQEIRQHIEYSDFMNFQQLAPGDQFGARMLIPYEELKRMRRAAYGQQAVERYIPVGADPKEFIESESDEQYHMKALLSIVADSTEVDAWVLDRNSLIYLSDKELKMIYEKVAYQKDSDRPLHEQDLNFIIEQFNKWDKHKVNSVEALFERKKIEKKLLGGKD